MSARRYVVENESPSINNDTGSPELISVKERNSVEVTFEIEESIEKTSPPEDSFNPLGLTTLEGLTDVTDENTIAAIANSSSPQEITQKNKIPVVKVHLNDKLSGDVITGEEAKTEDIAEGEKSEEKGKDEDDPKPVSLAKLFSYATCVDWILMIMGIFFSILHGMSLPIMALILGQLINLFTGQEITQDLAPLAPVLPMTDNDTDCDGILKSVYWGTPVFNLSTAFPNVSFNGREFPACSYVINETSTLTTLIKMCRSNLTDCVNNDMFIRTVNRLALSFLGIAGAVFICAFLMVALFQAADERQVKKLRLQFYKAILRQEVGWFDTHSTGSLASRITNDLDKIREGIGDKIALLFSWVTTFVGGFIVAFITDWRLSLVCLGIVPFLAIVVFFSANLTTALSSREQTQYAMAGTVAEEVISSIRTVVAFGGEKQALKRYKEKLKVAHLAGIKKGASVGLNLGLVFFLFFTFDAITFWFGGWLISQRFIEGGEVLIVLFAILLGAFAVGKAGPNVEALLTAAGSAGAVLQIINKESLIDPYSEEGEEPTEFDGTIEFKDVTFSYPARPDITILDGFNLKIEAGKTYAFVGPSGCGKSTVIQLLLRFYDPDSGEVHLGGKDIRSLKVKWLRQHIGIVSQEPVLFDTTIAENIRYGKEDATDDEVTQAAKNANAHDFISQLPDRYDTFVGEGGTQLSGGQKQRIAIARALLNNPKILLLDEATSALDTESESIVQQALDCARSGRTTIVIAHRLSTIQNADLIVSIEDGRVVEMGTHFELMDQEGLYCELVTAQSQGADFAHPLSSRKMTQASLISRRPTLVQQQSLTFRRLTLERRHTFPSGSIGSISLEKQLSSRSLQDIETTEEIIWSDEEERVPEVSLWRIMKKNAPEWWIILIGFIAAAVHGAIFPSFAVFFGQVLRVFTQPPELVLNSVHMWAALLLVMGVFSIIIIFLQGLCFSISGENLTSRLRSESFYTIMRQEMAWFDSKLNSSSELVIRLATDASKVQEASGMRLGSIVEVGVGMIAAIIIAFVYSWALALLILPCIPIILIGGLLEVKIVAGSGGKSKKDLERAGKVAVDSISHIRTVAALSLEDVFLERFTKNVMGPYRKALKNVPLHGLTFGFSQCIMFLMFCIVFRFGAFQITLPEDNPARAVFTQVVVVFAAVFFAATGAGQASAFLPEYTKAKISANKIFHLLDRKPLIDGQSEEGQKPESVTGDVSAHAVEFNYPARPDVKVLQKLDVSVKTGQTLALVGPSGCGKSTVVSLLQRFYNPLSGHLTLDGIDITDLNIRWLREHIGIVSQEPVLFDASVADNIRYGANFREVSQEEVIEAAKTANIHEFVSSLPKGYDTNVGAKGTQLSGGQKQRIAIARALIRNPKILLLDEATSALDTESEKIVQEALDRAREGRTSIVIAHRLSTIYNADCIAVITNGKVAEMGTHRELMEKKGIYYKLNSFQRKASPFQ